MAEPFPYHFSRRIRATPRSFIREILKVTEKPDIISFAGGLPSPGFLDAGGVARATVEVLREEGRTALQYSTTEGCLALRKWIAERYAARYSLEVSSDEVLITNGSQQTLDLVARIFLDEGDAVGIEAPGYLGAIQAFSQSMPRFCPVALESEGPDLHGFSRVMEEDHPVFFYGIPNSQNPSGITWSAGRRKKLASLIGETESLVVEDDAYGEIRFDGRALRPLKCDLPDRTVLCGTFSKIVAPGLRLGWMCAPAEILDKAITAKQASDLHTSIFSQLVLSRYLETEDIDAHIRDITRAYAARCNLMVSLMEERFPEEVSFTRPDGGMFVWLTLPGNASSMELWRRAMEEKVAILPGTPFYTDGGGDRGVRLNFSNADPEKIRTGISRLADVLDRYLGGMR
jgi:2-aminoadipate transaminase